MSTEDSELKVHLSGGADEWKIDPAPDLFSDPVDLDNAPMPLRKNIEGAGGAKTKARHEDDKQYNSYEFYDLVEPKFRMEHLLALYEQSSVHYSACQAKVANVIGLGFDLADSQASRERVDQIGENEAKLDKYRRSLQRAKFATFDMLDDLNEEADFLETLMRGATDYETFGNCYFEVGRKSNGAIGYFGHVPAATIRVRKRRDGFIQLTKDEKPVFFRNFQDTQTKDPTGRDSNPNELIHIKQYHPSGTYYGVPDIVAALQELAGNKFAADFNLEYFENKAIPKYIMTVSGKKVSTKVQSDMFNFFEANFKGKHHRLLIVPVDTSDGNAKVEFNPIEAGVQDSSFNTYYQSNIDGILMAHRTPITKLGNSGANVSVAMAKDLDMTFKSQVCRPRQRQFEKRINKVVGEFTNAFRFKLNELTLSDEKTQADIDEIYIRNQVVVPNEIRSGRWGWPGLPDGNKPLDLSAKKDDMVQNQKQNRTRDAARRENSVDSTGGARNAAGEGRKTS